MRLTFKIIVITCKTETNGVLARNFHFVLNFNLITLNLGRFRVLL